MQCKHVDTSYDRICYGDLKSGDTFAFNHSSTATVYLKTNSGHVELQMGNVYKSPAPATLAYRIYGQFDWKFSKV